MRPSPSLIILSVPNGNDPWNSSIFAGGETFASKIANNAAEFDSPEKTGAYIAAGLVLFVVTFLVNSAARIIVARSGPGGKRPRQQPPYRRHGRADRRSHPMTTLAANSPAYDGQTLDLTGKSGARAFKNTLATVLIVLCFVDRADPAAVDPRGPWSARATSLLLNADWWSQSQRGITVRRSRRRRLPRDHGHADHGR